MISTVETFSRHIIQDVYIYPVVGEIVLVHAKSADDEKYYFTTQPVLADLKKKHDPDSLVQILMRATGDEVLPKGLGEKYGPHCVNFHLLTDHGKKLLDEGGFLALYNGADKPKRFHEGKNLLNVIKQGNVSEDHMIAVSWSSHCMYDIHDLTRPLSRTLREEIWGSYYNVDQALPHLLEHPWVKSASIEQNPVWQNHSISGSRVLPVEVLIPQDVYEQMAQVCLEVNGFISPNTIMEWLTKPDSYGEHYAKHAPSIGPDPLGIMPFHQIQKEADDPSDDWDDYSDY